MSEALQFGAGSPKMNAGRALDPEDILTPEELATRLKVSKSWIFEQTRQRARVRNKNPMPCIRLGKYIRFNWVSVCTWMEENS